jgi:hypothetical protein
MIMKFKDTLLETAKQADKGVTEIKTSERWPKLKVHGVPLHYWLPRGEGTTTLRSSMAHQIEIEIDSLRWLLSDQMIQERMADPTAKASNSTIVITLRDINTAEKILQKATLYVAGKPRKVERYNEVAADTQCPTCQSFGHREEMRERAQVRPLRGKSPHGDT